MPRKKEEEQIPNLLDTATEIASARGIPLEGVLHALENALKKGFVNKVLQGDMPDMPPAVVECNIDPETGKVYLAQIKDVVDEVEDDYLQIEVEEANEGLTRKKYKAGDKYAIEADLSDLTIAMQKGFVSYLHQELAEAERTELYKIYKDRIGEMVVGTVEKADDRSVTVKLGRTTVEMGKRDLIRNEYFKVGDVIKVYIQEVRPADEEADDPKKRGPQIEITRSSDGFLKRLFEEEIHEIYDGTVVIKGIARLAGVRAKIAVATNNPDVDPTGACIGQGGSRIQKIVEQLGNSPSKEKLDIIEWSEYAPKFIIESVHPVQAIGVIMNEEEKAAKVLVSPDTFYKQASRFRNNLPLASRLTGYRLEYLPINKLEGQEFISVDEAEATANRIRAERAAEEFRRKTMEDARRLEEERRRIAEEEAARKAAEEAERRKKEEASRPERVNRAEPLPEMPAVTPKAAASEADFPMEAMNPAAAALAALSAAKQMEEAAPSSEPVETPSEKEMPTLIVKEKPKEEKRDVQTTTTLDALEADLEASKKTSSKPTYNKTGKRPRKIGEDEVKRPAAPKIPSEGLGVTYTEAELAEIEQEEANASLPADLGDDDDIDYDDYDEYYDE